VSDRVNRKAIQNRSYKLTGMAYCQHRMYGGMLVVMFADGFTLNERGKRELRKRSP